MSDEQVRTGGVHQSLAKGVGTMTKRLIFPILLVFFTVCAATSACAYRGGGYGMGPGMMHGQGGQGYGYGQGYGMGPGMMYGPGYGMGPDMYGYGGDPKELREVYEMRQQYAEETYPLRKEYFEKTRHLASELSSETPDKAKVHELVERIKVVWGKLFDASVDLGLKMSAKGLGGYGMGFGGMGPGMGGGMMHGYPGYN
jgi:hypothetical protein